MNLEAIRKHNVSFIFVSWLEDGLIIQQPVAAKGAFVIMKNQQCQHQLAF